MKKVADSDQSKQAASVEDGEDTYSSFKSETIKNSMAQEVSAPVLVRNDSAETINETDKTELNQGVHVEHAIEKEPISIDLPLDRNDSQTL